jgi:hypothetical protein
MCGSSRNVALQRAGMLTRGARGCKRAMRYAIAPMYPNEQGHGSFVCQRLSVLPCKRQYKENRTCMHCLLGCVIGSGQRQAVLLYTCTKELFSTIAFCSHPRLAGLGRRLVPLGSWVRLCDTAVADSLQSSVGQWRPAPPYWVPSRIPVVLPGPTLDRRAMGKRDGDISAANTTASVQVCCPRQVTAALLAVQGFV